ncbi:MAG TPA: NAD(P)H-hydrate dehydratase, partial [Gemmataceae bacterium]|nr:NAD(P)H-hydrate dehydratase [Gemmataceae bacterium]
MQPAAAEVVTQVPSLAPRSADSHKGDFGRVLVVAGSRGMSGAAVLCASGALRGGAGLVFLAVPAGIQDRVSGANPCYLTIDLPQDDQGRLAGEAAASILSRAKASDVLALGPGLGQSDALRQVVAQI